MAALFRAPKAPPMAPLPPVQPYAAPPPPRPMPARPPPAADPETPGDLPEDAGDARIAMTRRRRRGRSGTIATSWRGVLTERSGDLRRKTLLGE